MKANINEDIRLKRNRRKFSTFSIFFNTYLASELEIASYLEEGFENNGYGIKIKATTLMAIISTPVATIISAISITGSKSISITSNNE